MKIRKASEEDFEAISNLIKKNEPETKGFEGPTILQHETCLIALGTIKRYSLSPTKDDLINADKRFPDWIALRKEINQRIGLGEELGLGEIADKLNIPRIMPHYAFTKYGIRYQAYNNLYQLLSLEVERGTVIMEKEGKRCFYDFESRLPTAREYREKRKLEREKKCHNALKKIGPCSIGKIEKELEVESHTASIYMKKLKERGNAIRIKAPQNRKVNYDFFSVIFPVRSGYLWIDPNDPGNLERLTQKLIGCLHKQIYPWTEEHIDYQLDELRENGLPEVVYNNVKKSYTKKTLIVVTDSSNISITQTR